MGAVTNLCFSSANAALASVDQENGEVVKVSGAATRLPHKASVKIGKTKESPKVQGVGQSRVFFFFFLASVSIFSLKRCISQTATSLMETNL